MPGAFEVDHLQPNHTVKGNTSASCHHTSPPFWLHAHEEKKCGIALTESFSDCRKCDRFMDHCLRSGACCEQRWNIYRVLQYNNIDWTNEFNSSLWSTPSLEIQTSSHHKFQESGRRDYEWCRAGRKVSALKKWGAAWRQLTGYVRQGTTENDNKRRKRKTETVFMKEKRAARGERRTFCRKNYETFSKPYI